ncbi:hypothetical protein FQN49_000177 [Arthroderma sp. PD_2]|nr:hypothetical protein FQN49_000177 [Arthroderma sp. PD_2]
MQRSKTASETTFRLPGPDGQPVVIFVFARRGEPFCVAIPENSDWRYWDHWESPNSSICTSVKVLDGVVVASICDIPDRRSSTNVGGKGTKISFPPDTISTWCSRRLPRLKPEDLIVTLVGDEDFHRNICSAITDRDRMASLASTPFPLRYLLSFLNIFSFFRPLRKWILDIMLAIQLRMIFYTYGFWVRYPTIPFFWWWRCRQIWGEPRVPEWAFRLDWQMETRLAYIVQSSCYWIGKLLLGMKGSYPEYAPAPEPEDGGPEPVEYEPSESESSKEKRWRFWALMHSNMGKTQEEKRRYLIRDRWNVFSGDQPDEGGVHVLYTQPAEDVIQRPSKCARTVDDTSTYTI